MRITRDNIRSLQPNEIFVFGSNLSGIHGGGAALLAYERFKAKYGQGIGLQGFSYAIPTKSEGIKRTLTIEEIKPYVDEFIKFAQANKHLIFFVTEIGCGLAGHIPEHIAPLFRTALTINNIHLPQKFWDALK